MVTVKRNHPWLLGGTTARGAEASCYRGYKKSMLNLVGQGVDHSLEFCKGININIYKTLLSLLLLRADIHYSQPASLCLKVTGQNMIIHLFAFPPTVRSVVVWQE